jgi:tetratricopeptide (TPR) repeat protein
MKRGKIFTLAAAIIVMVGFTVSLTHAQAGRGKGRIKGKVIDGKTKKPFFGAKVVIHYAKDENLKHETKTNKKGEWAFIGLGTGEWRLTATADGYVPDREAIHVSQFSANPYIILKLKKPEKMDLAKEAGLVAQGNSLYEEGKYDEALETFKKFQKKTPEFYEVHINIANCLMKQEKYDEAIAEYNTFLEKAEEEKIELKAQALASIGEIHLKQDDIEKAQSFFMKSVELNPKDEILAYNVAEIFFGNNKNEEAVKYYNIASQIKPKWGIPYLKLGYVYLNLGDMKKAVESFTKFVEVDPGNPEVPAIKDLIKSLEGM